MAFQLCYKKGGTADRVPPAEVARYMTGSAVSLSSHRQLPNTESFD